MDSINKSELKCNDGLKNEGFRLKCIDVLRGMAVALMLICDNHGNPERIYPLLRHAAWNGCTIADLGFPFFLIIMGMVVPFSIERRIKNGKSLVNICAHIFIRSIGIFVLGIFLNGFPLYDFSVIRIPGVLQRIAIDYLIVSFISLTLKKFIKNNIFQMIIELIISLFIVIIYYLLLKFVTVPNYGSGIFERNGNLVQYIDLYFFKNHLYTPNWDPEGILSTICSIASALLGTVIGGLLMYKTNKKIKKIFYMFCLGIGLLIFSSIMNIWFPFNKNLWSSSFVLLTAGLACISIIILYVIVDIMGSKKIFKPFMILGSNAIFVYVVSEILGKSLWLIPVMDSISGKSLTLNIWITNHMFTPWAGNKLDSLYFSIAYMLIWVIIMGKFKNSSN